MVNTMFGVFMFLCTPQMPGAPHGWLAVDWEPWPIIYRVGRSKCYAET